MMDSRSEVSAALPAAIAEVVGLALASADYSVGSRRCTSAREINAGLCEEFAYEVLNHLGWTDGQQADVIEYANLTGPVGCEVADEVFYLDTLTRFGIPLPAGITVDRLNEVGLGFVGTHVFIRCEGRFYDAECPSGVTSPFSLPFAERYLTN
jgi:hypothetical protein